MSQRTPAAPAGSTQSAVVGAPTWIPVLWAAVLALIILGPALLPGYVLSYDMVFAPHQSLLPWMFGAEAGLPRAVPQDPLVGFVSGPLPGQILQKAALFGALWLTGLGVNRLLGGRGQFSRNRQRSDESARGPASLGVRLAAMTIAVWNPFVAERLVIGHWALLLAYAAAPWVLVQSLAVRRAVPKALPKLVLAVALGCLVPSAAVFTTALVLPVVVLRSAASATARLCVAGAVLLLTSTWWVAAILNPNTVQLDPAGNSAFALRSENWAGLLGSAISGGGIWNGDAVAASRALPWVPVISLVLFLAALVGFAQLAALFDRTLVRWLGMLAALGAALAVLGGWALTSSLMSSLISAIPGGGLLRDGQKLLAPLVLLIALAAPLGVEAGVRRLHGSKRAQSAVLVGLVAVPVVVLPDLAGGAFGKLSAVSYPDSWNQMRDRIAAGTDGDAISLPWNAFRRYDWNADRVVLDPLPRYLPITVLTDDRLPVRTENGLVFIGGDSERSAAVNRALLSAEPLAEALPPLGVRYVLQQTDQPNQLATGRFQGLELVGEYEGLQLWQAPAVVASPTQSGPALWFLVVLNLGSLVVVLGATAGTLAPIRRGKGERAPEK